MQLSVIQLDPRYYSILDMYTLEQFYINHLNSRFNAVKFVHFAALALRSEEIGQKET